MRLLRNLKEIWNGLTWCTLRFAGSILEFLPKKRDLISPEFREMMQKHTAEELVEAVDRAERSPDGKAKLGDDEIQVLR